MDFCLGNGPEVYRTILLLQNVIELLQNKKSREKKTHTTA